MYLARRYIGASLREIVQRLRVRDISTVGHGEKRITQKLHDKSATGKELKAILKKAYSLIQA
jgi:chromosomal replication initiation ATPase DnaA